MRTIPDLENIRWGVLNRGQAVKCVFESPLTSFFYLCFAVGMDWTRILTGLGILSPIASIRPILWFQRPMCPNLGSGDSCAPNPSI